jgi:hypothetical protein
LLDESGASKGWRGLCGDRGAEQVVQGSRCVISLIRRGYEAVDAVHGKGACAIAVAGRKPTRLTVIMCNVTGDHCCGAYNNY